MNELSQYFVEQCKSARDLKLYNIKNRLNLIEFDSFFKETNKHMVNNRLVEITPNYRKTDFSRPKPIKNCLNYLKLKKY